MRLSREELIKGNDITSLFTLNCGILWYLLFFLRFLLLLYLYFSLALLNFPNQKTKKKDDSIVRYWLLPTSPKQPTDRTKLDLSLTSAGKARP